MPDTRADSEYYTPQEVVGKLGYTLAWFRKKIFKGEPIPGLLKIGGRWKILKTDFDSARRESQQSGTPFLLPPKVKAHAAS